MKKFLITITALLTLSYNSNSADFKSGFYIVGDIGLSKNSSKLENDTYDSIKKQKPEGLKIKSNHGFMCDIALGYRFADNIRFDIKASADKSDYSYKSDTFQETSLMSDTTRDKEKKRNDYSKDIKIEAKDLDLSTNGYYDFPNLFRGVRHFIVVGVGVTNKKIKTVMKNTNYTTENFVANNIFCHNLYLEDRNKVCNYLDNFKYVEDTDKIIETEKFSDQSKETHIYISKLNPFYTVGLGVSFTHEDTPNSTIDFTYKFKRNLRYNYKSEEIKLSEKIKSHSHYFLMGVRYHF